LFVYFHPWIFLFSKVGKPLNAIRDFNHIIAK
jgi:hypothetical protein